MIPSWSSSNANRGRGGGGSRSRSHSHGGERRGSKDGGDDKRNWPLSTVHTFIKLAFEAQKMRTHDLRADFSYGCKDTYLCLVCPLFGGKLIAMLK
jgi:hypothetical protein